MGLWDRPWMRVQRHPTVGKSLPKPPCPHSQNNSRGRCSISKTLLSLMFLRVSVDESIVGGKPLSFLPCPSSKQAQRTALKLINIHEVVNSGRNLDGCAPPLFPALLFTHQGMSDSLWPHGLQQVKPLCPSPSPRVCPGSHPLNWWCHPTNSSSVDLLTSAFNLSQHQGLFNESALCIRWPKNWSFNFCISPCNEYSGLISLKLILWNQDWLVSSPWCPRDSWESSPAPQFESIISSALSLLHSPTLTSVPDYWRDHSLDYTDLCQQSGVFDFPCTVYICHSFPAEKQPSFNFMAAVTIRSDFRAQEKEICHYFHLFPFYLPWSDGTRCHDLISFFF